MGCVCTQEKVLSHSIGGGSRRTRISLVSEGARAWNVFTATIEFLFSDYIFNCPQFNWRIVQWTPSSKGSSFN